MKSERHWWDGPWPWLIYLPTYAIPWIWLPPTTFQLLLSAIAIAIFLSIYLASFRTRERGLLIAVAAMVFVAIASMPIGGGWTAFSIYPAIQATRIRPRQHAVIATGATVLAFLLAGLVSGLPLVWWLPSLIAPTLLGGAALSREIFYEQTYALLATQEEVRRLAGFAERERIARDLHDTIGRTLTLVALKADLISRLTSCTSEDAGAEARLIAVEARTGLQQVSAALNGQIGGSLEREIGDSLRALTSASIEAHERSDPTNVPGDVGALLAMTLREAVTNVIRHASATCCTIEVEVNTSGVRLTVSDNGIGGPIEEGNGLTGMRQRLFAAGGYMSVVQQRRGLMIVATVPL